MDVLRLTLRQLQIFVAVARSGSTSAASGELALSQSATSSAVNELERLLSLSLFDRAGKRLLLNDNGRALLPRAQSLIDGAVGVERMAREGIDQAQFLRIGASTTIGNYVLPALLRGFFEGQLPDQAATWKSRVTIGNTAAVSQAVSQFELDVGLIEGPCHEASLLVTPWVQDELVVVAASHSELARAAKSSAEPGRVPLKALREAVWLLREPGSGTRETTDQAVLPHLRSYRRSMELGSSEAIKRAVAEDLGVACLSRWVVEDWLQAGRLRLLPTTLPKLLRQCHLVVHRQKQPTAALLRFIEQTVAQGSVASSLGQSGLSRSR